jgi:hypothetical protein
MASEEQLLRAILATVARQTFPVGAILDVVAVGSDKAKQIRAYNLCDGSRSQGEVAKIAGLDSGNFSKTLTRWIDAGIVIRIGENRDIKLVHVYPLPDTEVKRASKSNGK